MELLTYTTSLIDIDSISTVFDSVHNDSSLASQILLNTSDTLPINLPKPIRVSEEQNGLVVASLILGLVSSIAVVVSAIFAYLQWKKAKHFNGVKYVQKIRESLSNDEEVAEVLLWFAYGTNWYSSEFHASTRPHIQVDRTLSILAFACYLKNKNYINDEQFSLIKYDIDKSIGNTEVQEYLFNLYHFTDKISIDMPFYYFLQYGRDSGAIEDDFDDANSLRYRHFLNY